jgi:cysteine desulfurase
VEQNHITELKNLIIQLKTEFPDFKINGTPDVLYCIECSIAFCSSKTAMLLFHLDMKGIAVLAEVCQSGSIKPSHVLAEMLSDDDLKAKFTHFV